MDESVNAPEGQTDSTVVEQAEKTDTVAYESYQKLLKEKKSRDAQLKERDEKLKLLEREKLEAEGNKDKILEEMKRELEELKGNFSKKEKHYAWKTVSSKIAQEAIKLGCKDPNKLIRLMDDSDLSAIEIGEDFSVDAKEISLLVEKSKGENPFLFDSTNKVAAHGTPSKKVENTKEKSENELFAAYIKNLK